MRGWHSHPEVLESLVAMVSLVLPEVQTMMKVERLKRMEYFEDEEDHWRGSSELSEEF
jgi:hypothetical protein